jgi:class 3 adenylate cyclase
MGGRVAKKLGDGLMVVFGYPVAQEMSKKLHNDLIQEACRSLKSCLPDSSASTSREAISCSILHMCGRQAHVSA